jgi:L-threonylcarbamoyladenylate synthase
MRRAWHGYADPRVIVLDARTGDFDDIVEQVAGVVFGGGTVIFPTDTSYAIGCDPYRSEAIDRIYVTKGRPDERPLTMHVATPAEFLEYARDNKLAMLAAKRLLPGPVILRIRKPEFVSDELAAALETVAMRVPDDALARAILERCGPLAATTANPGSDKRYLGDDDYEALPPADLLVQHGPTRYDRESSIVDISGSHARLLREGVVSAERLSELLGPIERPTIKVRTQI